MLSIIVKQRGLAISDKEKGVGVLIDFFEMH